MALGIAAGAQGPHADAVTTYKALLPVAGRIFGAEHPQTLKLRSDRAQAMGALATSGLGSLHLLVLSNLSGLVLSRVHMSLRGCTASPRAGYSVHIQQGRVSMQVRYARRLRYAAVWAALAVATASCGPGASASHDSNRNAPTPTPQAYAGTAELPESLSPDGTTILVGNPQAKTVVRLYEDPRCPVVADFESTGAEAIRTLTVLGRTRTEYALASFKDGSLGGDGSRRAVNAPCVRRSTHRSSPSTTGC
ncbi:hypothetical protein [Streptomyces virginiae]|uniref:hypothetical protein n=1 Tax=Streptomyces virginiae TaxID=1961 RepID=UPI003453112E